MIKGLLTASTVVNNAWNAGLVPPPLMSLPEWAERYYVLGAKEPEPGPFRIHRTPYLREPMECMGPTSEVRSVAVMKGSQLGLTKAALAKVGMVLHADPAEALFVLPRMEDAKKWVKRQLKPMLADVPALRGVIRPARERDSGNTLLLMEYGGGYALNITWSSSASGLKSIPAPLLIFDEVDSFVLDADGEGDPVDLAEKRSTNFPNRKSIKISTPSDEHTSRIRKAFLAGDQRRYFVPCPHCGRFQVLLFESFRYLPAEAKTKDDVREAWFECVGCHQRIEETVKDAWYAPDAPQGHWIATRHQPDIVHAGFPSAQLDELLADKAQRVTENASFQLSQFYAPIGWTGSSWLAIAQQWVEVQGDHEREKGFSTHVKGEPIRVKGDMPDYRLIEQRAENYPLVSPFGDGTLAASAIPERGLVLTAAADIQSDWIEVELRAWGRNLESWSVGHLQLAGDTLRADAWRRLADVLEYSYPHQLGGALSIQAMAIDCGFRPEMVYEFARAYPRPVFGAGYIAIPSPRTVICVRGGHNLFKLIEGVSPIEEARKRFGLRIVTMSSHLAKLAVYDRLRLPAPRPHLDEEAPRGFLHLPRYDAAFFKGLTAEKLVMRDNGGLDWVKEYPRNEPLDCAAYQHGLSELLQLSTWPESRWAAIEAALNVRDEKPVTAQSRPTKSPVLAIASNDPFLD